MKTLTILLLSLVAMVAHAANPTFNSFNTNQFVPNSSANTIRANTNAANPNALVSQKQLQLASSNNIPNLNGPGTNTMLYNAAIMDLLNFGDTSGSAGTLTFAPGPANAWEDFTFGPGTAPMIHFHITGDPYWTGVAHGSGAAITDIPISGLNTNDGQNGQVATVGSDGAVHWSNGPPVSVAGIQIPMTFVSPYSGNTNFYLDFSQPAQVLNTPTNVIVFNYATNWASGNTSRVANVFIQWTNYGRLVYFTGAATNWHISPAMWYVPPGYGARLQATAFGQLDTNVMVTTFIDSFPVGSNTTASFNPTNVFPTATKLWVDASRLVYQDEAALTPVQNGSVARAWKDLSLFTTGLSNNTSLAMANVYQTPQSGPYNVPNMAYFPGATWMQTPSFGSLGPPMWGFIVFYGRNMGTVLDDLGTRFAFQPGESGQSMSFFSGSGLSANGQPNVSWVLFSFFSNSPNSIIRTNGSQASTGITGNPAATAWLVGSDNSRNPAQGTANVAEILILQTNLTAAQLTNVESYFYRKYPFWNPPTVQ